MEDRYTFLVSMKILLHEITELSAFIKKSSPCCERLTEKLNELSAFVVDEKNEKQWRLWESDQEIKKYASLLRETSSAAVAALEKHQSVCTTKSNADMSGYFSSLSSAVKMDAVRCEISGTSEVFFIGSGAFPLSALTIAKETGARLTCLDIDEEAVEMGREIAGLSGLRDNVRFTSAPVSELPAIKRATHVVIASLVKEKTAIIEQLSSLLPHQAKVILRYGNGLKSIFNYPYHDSPESVWKTEHVYQDKRFYDTLILTKKAQVLTGKEVEYS
ncbi:nicotianamine synthase family protein [Metabacillus idriensis]|uniref:nicotianamine synthase family protein n=1 Tax=Metabacillus idriensis TaxID=324768 RepID=UPI003D2C90EF